MANPVLAADRFTKPVGRTAASATMTARGALVKALAFLVIVLAGGALGWSQVHQNRSGNYDTPGWLWLVSLLTFFLGMMAIANPAKVPLLGALYSLGQGVVMGAISHVYEGYWNGIVGQALLVTVMVVGGAILANIFGLVKFSAKLQGIIIVALFGIMLLYVVAFFFRLFGVKFSFIYDSSGLGIAFGVLLVALAALAVINDISAIFAAEKVGAPKVFEWYAAWGLMVSVIWLYGEILSLLARLAAAKDR
ncbi:MAG: Bax inhibitor-1/YccA family protein [Actinomycetota bacterium]